MILRETPRPTGLCRSITVTQTSISALAPARGRSAAPCRVEGRHATVCEEARRRCTGLVQVRRWHVAHGRTLRCGNVADHGP